MSKQFALFSLCLVACLAIVAAECPNGCSGSGTCGNRDMCTCYKTYQGNDCSERVCPFAYAHADTYKGDLNMDGSITDTFGLTNSQVYPAQTYEGYNTNAGTSEAHFYMECANAGLCDRATGNCQCFEQYEGSACQRQKCPNSCSGHGTCESIAEFGTKSGGTLFLYEGLPGAVTYELWDSAVTYGCRCDPRYGGADCSERKCKVGIDPMYQAAGREILETFTVRATLSTPSTPAETIHSSSSFRLRVFDFWGESFITTAIGIVDDTASTQETVLEAAIEALPTGAFTDVTCREVGQSPLNWMVHYTPATTLVMHLACQYTTNPGVHRLPEVVDCNVYKSAGVLGTSTCVVTTTPQQGENTDYCGLKSTAAVTIASDSTSLVMDVADTTITYPVLLKVQSQYFLATSRSTVTVTLAYKWKGTAITTAVDLFYSSATIATHADTIDVWALGATSFTTTGTATITRSTVIFVQNTFFTVTAVSGTTVTVNKGFPGLVNTGGPIVTGGALAIYTVATPTANTYTYVSECSGRGICDSGTGLCTCFKGYTNDNCNTQNTLAL